MRARDRRWDVLLALAAAVALIVDGMNRRHGGALPAGGYVLALAACAPLAWRRDAPLPVLLVVFVGVIACLPVFHPYDTAIFPVMIALFTVAALGGIGKVSGIPRYATTPSSGTARFSRTSGCSRASSITSASPPATTC